MTVKSVSSVSSVSMVLAFRCFYWSYGKLLTLLTHRENGCVSKLTIENIRVNPLLTLLTVGSTRARARIIRLTRETYTCRKDCPMTRMVATFWEFLGLAWRESPAGGRVSLRTAWRIARLYHTDCPRRKEV